MPDTYEDIIKLPGVGRKMTHLLLQYGFGKVEGISVDTHIHRVANRLEWVKNRTRMADQTARELEEWVPKNKWS